MAKKEFAAAGLAAQLISTIPAESFAEAAPAIPVAPAESQATEAAPAVASEPAAAPVAEAAPAKPKKTRPLSEAMSRYYSRPVTRTKHLHLVLAEDVSDAIRARAAKENLSLNEWAHKVFTTYLQDYPEAGA